MLVHAINIVYITEEFLTKCEFKGTLFLLLLLHDLGGGSELLLEGIC